MQAGDVESPAWLKALFRAILRIGLRLFAFIANATRATAVTVNQLISDQNVAGLDRG